MLGWLTSLLETLLFEFWLCLAAAAATEKHRRVGNRRITVSRVGIAAVWMVRCRKMEMEAIGMEAGLFGYGKRKNVWRLSWWWKKMNFLSILFFIFEKNFLFIYLFIISFGSYEYGRIEIYSKNHIEYSIKVN